MSNNNLPAIIPAKDYALMQTDFSTITEAIKENLGGSTINTFDLDQIRVPAAGGTTWTIPTLEGEKETKALSGVIIYFRDPKAWWEIPFDQSGGGSPPDCSSEDGQVGVGRFGGDCAVCPMNQFGSGKNGKGKACKDMRLLFMICEGNLLPYVITAPVMSVKPLKQYFLRLASGAVPYYAVQTTLTLEKDKNDDGITYSRIVPNLGARLDPAEAARFKEYAEAIKPALQRMTIDYTDGTVNGQVPPMEEQGA